MNPTVWLLVVFLTFFFLYWKRLWLAFRERRRFTHMINQLPGPMGLPLVGSALNFSPDTESKANTVCLIFENYKKYYTECTYQMELYFRTYTEDNDSSGIMRVWIGPKPLVFIYKPETAKVGPAFGFFGIESGTLSLKWSLSRTWQDELYFVLTSMR